MLNSMKMNSEEYESDRESPRHDASVRGMLMQVARGYGRALDMTVRMMAMVLISGILLAAMWTSLNAISGVLKGGRVSETVIRVVMLLCTPPIISAGVIGSGINRGRNT